MAQLQEREPIDLEVLKREGVGYIFKGKFRNEALALILKSQERQPRGRRGVKTITVTTRTKTSQWQRIPVGAKSDVDASVELQKFRASNLGYFAEQMHMGPNTFQRYMRQATPQAWLPRVKGFTKAALGAEATMHSNQCMLFGGVLEGGGHLGSTRAACRAGLVLLPGHTKKHHPPKQHTHMGMLRSFPVGVDRSRSLGPRKGGSYTGKPESGKGGQGFLPK